MHCTIEFIIIWFIKHRASITMQLIIGGIPHPNTNKPLFCVNIPVFLFFPRVSWGKVIVLPSHLTFQTLLIIKCFAALLCRPCPLPISAGILNEAGNWKETESATKLKEDELPTIITPSAIQMATPHFMDS